MMNVLNVVWIFCSYTDISDGKSGFEFSQNETESLEWKQTIPPPPFVLVDESGISLRERQIS